MNKLKISCYIEGPQDIGSQTMHFKGSSRMIGTIAAAIMDTCRNINAERVKEITAEEWHALDVQKEELYE